MKEESPAAVGTAGQCKKSGRQGMRPLAVGTAGQY